MVSKVAVRWFLFGSILLLTGCGPGLVFNPSPTMTPEQMLERASLVMVGVIEKQQFDSWPFFRVSDPDADPETARFWKVLRRQVRVEFVVRGRAPGPVVQVHEIFWTGAATGEWNALGNGDRALFLLIVENGRHRVVRDWLRSIFPVTGPPRRKLPLDDSHPLWERIALMNWWIEDSDEAQRVRWLDFHYSDPGQRLSGWRVVKLLRGLLRHNSSGVRVSACRALLMRGWGQDECWEMLSVPERARIEAGRPFCCSASDVAANRQKYAERGASWNWKSYGDPETRRLMTAMSNRSLRIEFCRLWSSAYPGDTDNGCPADRSPPATLVTERGDVPITSLPPGGAR